MKSLLAVALVATGAILHAKPLPIFYSYWPGWMRLEVGIKEGFLEEERVEMEFLMLEHVYSVEAFVAGWQVFAGYPLNGLGLSKLGYQFIADILKHCPALSAAFAPTGHQLQTRCAPRAHGQLFAVVFNSYEPNSHTNSVRAPIGLGADVTSPAKGSSTAMLASFNGAPNLGGQINLRI